MKKQKIIVDGKEVEVIISVEKEEIEDNSDLIDLEDTMDLSEVVTHE